MGDRLGLPGAVCILSVLSALGGLVPLRLGSGPCGCGVLLPSGLLALAVPVWVCRLLLLPCYGVCLDSARTVCFLPLLSWVLPFLGFPPVVGWAFGSFCSCGLLGFGFGFLAAVLGCSFCPGVLPRRLPFLGLCLAVGFGLLLHSFMASGGFCGPVVLCVLSPVGLSFLLCYLSLSRSFGSWPLCFGPCFLLGLFGVLTASPVPGFSLSVPGLGSLGDPLLCLVSQGAVFRLWLPASVYAYFSWVCSWIGVGWLLGFLLFPFLFFQVSVSWLFLSFPGPAFCWPGIFGPGLVLVAGSDLLFLPQLASVRALPFLDGLWGVPAVGRLVLAVCRTGSGRSPVVWLGASWFGGVPSCWGSAWDFSPVLPFFSCSGCLGWFPGLSSVWFGEGQLFCFGMLHLVMNGMRT